MADGGKLSVLDRLLSRLKAEDHRVLIYSQMTRMIDILEVGPVLCFMTTEQHDNIFSSVFSRSIFTRNFVYESL